MNAMAVAAVMTADEYLALGEGHPRTQLIEGEVVLNAPQLPHQLVCTRPEFALAVWSRAAPGRGLAIRPLDVRLNDRNVYNPDILWYAEDRAPRRGRSPPYPMPNIAVEVRSQSTWRYDVGVKRRVYEQQGLPELWLVDIRARPCSSSAARGRTRRSSTSRSSSSATSSSTSPQLPGFSLALSELFRDG